MAVCEAKGRGGKPCQRPAGWGTSHVGVGRCKLHGGASKIKHGLYSKYLKHTLSDTVQSLLDDPDLINLRQQIAFKQALLLDRINQFEAGMSPDDIRFFADLSEKVSRDIERLNKIEHGEKYILQVAEVQAVVQQITLIIHQEITDDYVIERVASRLSQLKW
ncbi:hypothetical protein SD71_09735 [Cohnella kolymensis]|uniref:Uncharacterized protein n=1 Tax=Cohnella kolymensis TaxID=1590652 RepID=A0ABR5A5L5_9BACL|nr:hypothetical protein [Cohnella kolymensis]KIL36217.1 hypothetical protein SD71_09735 [Cohnella kolymensis]